MKSEGVDFTFLKSYFEKDSFANLCGIELIEAFNGCAKAKLDLREHHLNAMKMPHGGLLFTLADLAFAAAVHSRGRAAVALNCTISYMKVSFGNVLYAQAKEVSRNNRTALYSVTVVDESDEIVAVFQGLAYIKKQRIGDSG
jgi:acyl-CoA thioesterase